MGSFAPYPVSNHCDGVRFFNPSPPPDLGRHALLRWKLTSRPARWPGNVPVLPSKPPAHTGGITATWINHSTFLLQTTRGNVLTDPVYSARTSPVSWAGPKRAHAPGIAFTDLPHIDLVLLSHDHYDHCDLPTLARINKTHAPAAITPLGNGPLLRAAGWAPEKITELDWWESQLTPSGVRVTATPAHHWSKRLRSPRNSRLWSGFYLETGEATACFVGDTGYDDSMFTAIRERLGSPDLAMVPIGAYEPRWFMATHHCNPDEAVRIHHDLGSRLSLAMHWGTFQLTDEAREAPPQALSAALAHSNTPANAFRVLAPGESARSE